MPFGRAEPPVSAALLADKALMGSSRLKTGASQVALVVKPPPPPATAGDTREIGLIPESGRSPGGGNGNPSSALAWRTPWTEKPGGLQSQGSKRVGHDRRDLAGTHVG